MLPQRSPLTPDDRVVKSPIRRSSTENGDQIRLQGLAGAPVGHAKGRPSNAASADLMLGEAAALSPVASQDMDLRDDEAEQPLAEGLGEELLEAFTDALALAPNSYIGGDGALQPDVADAIDEGVEQEVAEGLAQVLSQVDIGEEAVAVADGEVAEEPAPVQQVVERWQMLGPMSGAGYISNEEMRTVLRIQRGKPKKSVTVNCYLHPGCKLLLTEARCPDDEALRRWLYDVPAAAPGASKEDNRRLAEQHMQAGKSRWGGRRS